MSQNDLVLSHSALMASASSSSSHGAVTVVDVFPFNDSPQPDLGQDGVEQREAAEEGQLEFDVELHSRAKQRRVRAEKTQSRVPGKVDATSGQVSAS